MKILSLNKIEQKRLLSLCKEFFPEYGDYYHRITVTDSRNNVMLVEKFNSKYWLEVLGIHWYQLCLTELPKKIFEKLKKFEKGDDPALHSYTHYHGMWGSWRQLVQAIVVDEHPVDFLWNFVQDCKKHKYFKK